MWCFRICLCIKTFILLNSDGIIGFQIETQKIAIPFGAFIIVQEIYWYGDTLMLSYLKDMQAVGYYNAAYRLLEGMIVFPNLICQAVLPHLSRLYQADSSAHNRLSITLQKICVAVAVFLSGASFILAPLVIEWVFGEAYLHAIGIFEILSLGFFFVFTNIYFLNLLVSIDGQKLLWKLSLWRTNIQSGVKRFCHTNLGRRRRSGNHGAERGVGAHDRAFFIGR